MKSHTFASFFAPLRLCVRTILFVIAPVAVVAASVAAQTSLSLWPYYVEVTPERTDGQLYDLVVPLPVMDKARADLADLRLFDSANREVPYALRIRREIDVKREFPTRLFNYGVAGPATSEVSVDLGEDPGEHNEIDIETNGTNFRRQVVVEGSDSGREWRTLSNDGVIFSFQSQNNVADSPRVSYPTSRYRYLRVKVSRDPITDRETPQVTSVKVVMAVREKGQLSTWDVPVPSYQLQRNQGAHATVWTLDLGGRVPCDRLSLDIAEDSFSRPFQVETIDDAQDVRLIASGDLTRHYGEEKKPLVVFFNEEAVARKLRLQITDYSNPTLNIQSINASAPARQVVFELKSPASQPLRLYFGNENVPAPHYDFENEVVARLSREPVHSRLDEVSANREYKPEPKPLTERVPWLIYVVLAASSIALVFVLLNLARTTMRLNTQRAD